MAFSTVPQLTQRIIRRLRQVQGVSTQLYSEDVIADLIKDTYVMCRSEAWWDHLTSWQVRQLDGITGKVTVPFVGATQGFDDVHLVNVGRESRPLPIIANANPGRYDSGTHARMVQPLSVSDDPTGVYLFRIWPLTTLTTAPAPLRIHLRQDPALLFTDLTVPVPFDDVCLINGAAAKYAIDDGTNPATVAMLQTTFVERLDQLKQAFNARPLLLDPRLEDPVYSNEWMTWP